MQEHTPGSIAFLCATLTGVFGLTGNLLTNLVTWQKERNELASRTKSLEEANQRVDFWKTWLEAMALLPPTDARKVLQEIAEAEVMQTGLEVNLRYKKETPQERYETFVQRRRGLHRIRRWLLLYRPLNAGAWVLRLLLFAYLLGVPLFAYVSLSVDGAMLERVTFDAQASKSDVTHVARHWQHYSRAIVRLRIFEILLTFVIVLLALLFRLRSMRIETDGFPVSAEELSSIKYRLWPRTEANVFPPR